MHVNLKPGELYRCISDGVITGFDNPGCVNVKQDDILVYLGIMRDKHAMWAERHVFYHQKTMKFAAFTVGWYQVGQMIGELSEEQKEETSKGT